MYLTKKNNPFKFFKKFDYIVFFCIIILSTLGFVALYSATRVMDQKYNGNGMIKTQIMGFALGFVICLIITFIDYKDFKTYGIFLYTITISLLILVLFIGEGLEEVGSRAWLSIMGVNLQPSEPAKITFIIISSIFIERLKEEPHNKVTNIIKLVSYSFVPVFLIVLEPDMGTALVFLFIFAVMIFIYGIPFKYIFSVITIVIASMPFLWMYYLKPYQKNRIRVFLNPELDPMDAGFNVLQARIAIGSGELWGKGFLNGTQTQNKMVPMKWSDFIFTVIGEEFGFIISVATIIIICIFILRGVHIAKNSRDVFGSFVAIGIVAMFAFHFIENIGMNVGLLPVNGIPLPFISAGGSAMISYFIAAGILISISIRRKRTIFNGE